MSYREAGERPAPPEVQTWESKRKCVDCGHLLFGAARDGIAIEGCGACGGIWVANADAQRLLHSLNMNVVALADAAAKRATIERPNVPGERRCPDCAILLIAQQAANVVVDACREHGTWFDKYELRAVVVARMPVPAGPSRYGAWDGSLEDGVEVLRRFVEGG